MCSEADLNTVMNETGTSADRRARQFTELFETYAPGVIRKMAQRRRTTDVHVT